MLFIAYLSELLCFASSRVYIYILPVFGDDDTFVENFHRAFLCSTTFLRSGVVIAWLCSLLARTWFRLAYWLCFESGLL